MDERAEGYTHEQPDGRVSGRTGGRAEGQASRKSTARSATTMLVRYDARIVYDCCPYSTWRLIINTSGHYQDKSIGSYDAQKQKNNSTELTYRRETINWTCTVIMSQSWTQLAGCVTTCCQATRLPGHSQATRLPGQTVRRQSCQAKQSGGKTAGPDSQTAR